MPHLVPFSALLLAVGVFSNLAVGQNGAATTLNANPTTVAAGGTLGLTATVQPNNVSISPGHPFTKPTGSITFLDGTTPLDSTPVALTSNIFASASFQQTFGTPDPAIVKAYTGELTGDLNGDGIADLLVYGEQENPDQLLVQTFVSNGQGGYNAGALQTLSVTNYTFDPAVYNTPGLIDLNGDGKLDLLDGIVVADGNGDGTFAATVPVAFLSSGFISSNVADLNGDGKADILAVNASPAYPDLQYSITVFLNAGDGSFTSAGTYSIASGGLDTMLIYQPTFVDLNGDGKPDLVLQSQIGTPGGDTSELSELLNNGDGTFGAPTQLTVAYPPNLTESCPNYQTGSGDVNGDGKQDLVLALCDEFGNASAVTLLGNGDGSFSSSLYYALPAPPPNTVISILPYFVIQDVNLDGKLDLVFGDGNLALGNGDGTFTSAAPLFPLTGSPYSYPLAQMSLPGNRVPSLVYLLLSGTPTPAAAFTPQTSGFAALSLATLAVGAHSITARYSGDANYPADTSAAVAVTVNQAASATAATSSANPSFAGQIVTLTANVTSAGPAPTGNVTFTSGSTTLATVALSGGSASYTSTSFTTPGTQTINVSYSGDTNTQASSTSISQAVKAAFALAPGGSGSTNLTVQSGQTVSAPINVTGVTGFSGPVTFSCTGLPANSSCSFSPATITVSGTTVVPTLLSINTAATSTTSQLWPGFGTYGLALAGLVLLWPLRRGASRLWIILFCVTGFATIGLNGCSSGNGPAPAAQTAPGTYNFTVVASSGDVQTQSSYTLVVQ